MMYKQNFVCSLKTGGKILRETSGEVQLPFGSEYSVLLKNLHSRRAMAKVTVNGQDATEDTKLILQPNSTLELERFIRKGNLESGNKFKFVERTAEIENHRGIKEDDGLVRVEFWVEKEVIEEPIIRRRYYDDWDWTPPLVPRPYPYPLPRPWWDNGIRFGTRRPTRSLSPSASISGSLIRCASARVSNTEGITVPGSESYQKFRNTFGFETESNSHVIVLRLKGFSGDAPVETPITVDRKAVCSTCGRKNKAVSKFCSNCGTALVLI